MAKGEITLDGAYLKNSTTAIIKFHCNCKNAYHIKLSDSYGTYSAHSGSVRLYYSTTSTVTKDSDYTTMQMDLTTNTTYVSGRGYVSVIEWPLPAQNTTYYVQLRMRLYENDDNDPWRYTVGYYASYRAPESPSAINGTEPTPSHDPDKANQPLFMVAEYTDKQTIIDEGGVIHDQWHKEFKDFTQYVELPSYDVNYEDINEDWDDANYVTHRIRVRSKITGKLDLRFSDLRSYNYFMTLLKQSKERNGKGTAYVELQVQINDDPDEYTNSDLSKQRCTFKEGYFFVKLDSNPWVAPVFGHYDKYQAISLSITEA